MFSSLGDLCVLKSDLTACLCKFRTRTTVPPIDLVWCKDTPVLCWDGVLMLVGSRGDSHAFRYDSALVGGSPTFFFSTSRSMPAANAEDPRQSEGA